MKLGEIKTKLIIKWNTLSLRWKIYFLFVSTLSIAIIAVLIRGQALFQNDKNLLLQDLSSKLSSSTATGLSSRIEMLESKLVLLATTKDAPAQQKVLLSQSHDFLAVGLIQIDSQNQITVPWSSNTAHDLNERLIFSHLNFGGSRNFFILPETHRLVFALRVDIAAPHASGAVKNWMVGILPPSVFDDLLKVYSTGINRGFVVDQNNVALASSENTLQGRTLDFSKFIQSSNLISGTNLTAVVTTSPAKAFVGKWAFIRSVLIIGLALLLLSFSFITIFAETYISEPLKKLSVLISEGRYSSPFNVPGNDEIKEVASHLKEIDIRQKVAMAEVIKEQTEFRKREKNKVYELICGAMAREIKNPLSGILGHLQLALAKDLPEDVAKYLKISEKEIRRCRGVVENLGRFSMTEKMIFQPVSLVDVIQNAIELVEVQLSQAHCKLYKDLKRCSAVSGDSVQLQNAVAALLRNAAQAIDGSIKKNIIIRIFEIEGRARLQIEDTGMGISPELQDRIFEPFFTTKTIGKGIGLGLASSRGIIREHKGDISFESEKHKTVFTIDLPTINEKPKTQNFHPDAGPGTDQNLLFY